MSQKLHQRFKELTKEIREDRLKIGRPSYVMPLVYSVQEALLCGYNKISAIELGVASGAGLIDLCKAADYFQVEFGVDIEVYGFDMGVGMPASQDYRDHPELWQQGDFAQPDTLVSELPSRAKLIIGNVADTIPKLVNNFLYARIGFVSIDLDYYSSTMSAMPLFDLAPDNYLPAVPVYVDDMNTHLCYNPWCGEAAALAEFNRTHHNRKFEEKHKCWGMDNFHVFHVFDHPFRNGTVKPPNFIHITPL
jgi:hypothetical protein